MKRFRNFSPRQAVLVHFVHIYASKSVPYRYFLQKEVVIF